LVAAAVLAVALVPVVLAYLQLGYHADVRAAGDYEAASRDAVHFLERGVHDAAGDVTGLPWSRREAAAASVRTSLEPRLETLKASRVDEGVAYHVTYNDSAADRWADRRCPSGSGRAFGPCEATDGVVVQERAGETTVLAVAFDVRITHQRGETTLTLVVEPV
jgi:hypothetical protein